MSVRERLAARASYRKERKARIDRVAEGVRTGNEGGMHLETAPSRLAPGTFSHLYSSKDGALCLFEDAEGHLTSVNAKRLA